MPGLVSEQTKKYNIDTRLTLFVKNKLRKFNRNPKILRSAKKLGSGSPIQSRSQTNEIQFVAFFKF